MSIAALQTALSQYKQELKGSNTTRLAGAVYYHREWEVSANATSNIIKKYAGFSHFFIAV
jgi:hypothetical protein